MKTRPGRRRGLTRLARALGLDRNPLRRATDRAEAWVGQGGRVWAGAPGEGTGPSARTGEVLAAVMTLAAMALALLAVLRLALAFLNRRRLAAWETAWSRVGPQWSKRRP
jgi:hypothetical protein